MFSRTVPVAHVPDGFQQILDSRGETNHMELFMSDGSERIQIDDADFNRNVFPALMADAKMREGYSYPCIYKVDTKDRGVFDVRITDFSVSDRTVTLTLSIREPAFYLRPFMGQWHTGASHRVPTEDVMRFFADAAYPDWIGQTKRSMVNDGHTSVIPHVENMTLQRIRQWEDSAQAARPAVGDLVSMTLLPHQRSCVAWMMRQEQLGIGHDMWQELAGGVWYNALLDTFLPCQPVFSGGGILADIMGLGKTITTLALVANSPAIGPSLVVVPVTLVGQWEAEARRALPEGSQIIVYHGPRRPRDTDILSAATVVITTYEVLASDDTLWRRRHTGSTPYVPPLAGVYWARVVADEAHRLRETFTTRFGAIKALRARSRWCITGTPTTMTVDDLYGPLVFLRHAHLFLPVSYRCGTPALWRDLTRRGVNVVCRVIEGVMWRYAEHQVSIGQEITHHDHPIELSDPELSRYRTHAPTRVRDLSILTLLRAMTTMRRLCNGDTGDSRVVNSVEFTKRIRRALRVTPPSDPCPVCLEPADVAVAVGQCGHILCANCTEEILIRQTTSNRCPLCRANMVESSMTIVHDTTPDPEAARPDAPCAPDEKPSKISYLINHVGTLAGSGEKILVFTHWGTQSIVTAMRAAHADIPIEYICGGMSLAARKAAITRFENADSCAVFVINLRTGAVGINLTAANHVVLLEPSMCPGVRQQAIGRVYRLGQQRAVQVHHYFTSGTIEQKIHMQRGYRTMARSHTVPITANGMADGTYATETRRDLIEELF